MNLLDVAYKLKFITNSNLSKALEERQIEYMDNGDSIIFINYFTIFYFDLKGDCHLVKSTQSFEDCFCQLDTLREALGEIPITEGIKIA